VVVTITEPATAQHGASVAPIPPPLYFGAALLAGLGLRAVTVPLSIGSSGLRVPLGALVLGAGVALAGAGVAAVVRHHTTIVPHRSVATLLTTGVYRLSRNPMYAGLALAYLGGATMLGSWWPFLTLPLALLAVRTLVIGPEERYLAANFGSRFTEYRRHVRRWL
jgi:protein-S-isoprenylcysteine O-methyltransferase Ste14